MARNLHLGDASRGWLRADIVGEWLVFLTGVTIGGMVLWPQYVVDFVIGYVLGILFQYFAIKPMTDLSSREALFLAIRADTLSVIAFEVGMDCPGFDGGSGVS